MTDKFVYNFNGDVIYDSGARRTCQVFIHQDEDGYVDVIENFTLGGTETTDVASLTRDEAIAAARAILKHFNGESEVPQ